MRLLRALACLILALTLVGAPTAHARTVGAGQAAISDHGGHAATAHDCDGPARGHPAQDASDCPAACCFMPAQVPARVGAPIAVEFRRVPYPVAAQVLAGRVRAPDPEIPKRA